MQQGQKMVKVRITRGCYVRGTAYPEGAVIDVSLSEMLELQAARRAVQVSNVSQSRFDVGNVKRKDRQ